MHHATNNCSLFDLDFSSTLRFVCSNKKYSTWEPTSNRHDDLNIKQENNNS